MPIILSDTIKVKYKLDTTGMNSIEVARMLKDNGVRGFTMEVNKRYVIVAVPREDIKMNRKIMEGIRSED